MSDAIDDGMEDYGTEENIDKAYAEVCDELKIDFNSDAANAGGDKIAGKKKVKR